MQHGSAEWRFANSLFCQPIHVREPEMPSLITSAATESVLRASLKAEGFRLNKTRVNGETGVDILAIRGAKSIHIEVIAFKSSPPARSKDFQQSFFRAVSRIKDGASRCAIALPLRWKNGLPARATQYGVAWKRIGIAFPELEIWLVDTDSGSYSTSKWNDWLSNQPVERDAKRRAKTRAVRAAHRQR